MRTLSCLAAFLVACPSFGVEFKDGDRVVLIGGTMIEREQKEGYWETYLTHRLKDKAVTFRNLGWSGDDVFGTARVAFDLDKPGVGVKRLVELALALKPNAIVVAYGANESYAGEKGVEKLTKGLAALLDALAPAKARVVLLSPARHEDKGRPLPDPAAANKNLALYRDAVRAVAAERKVEFGDFYELAWETKHRPLTDNGVHFTADGYRFTAASFGEALGVPAEGADWKALEPLRKAVVAKNELYFYRWRPQNETYLFGFRKHEQGRNAKEVAEFDPMIGKAEDEIAKLKAGK